MQPVFTNTAKEAFDAAEIEARQHRCNYISTEHLLLGLTRVNTPNKAMRLLEQEFRISPDELRQRLLREIGAPGNMYDPKRPMMLTGNGRKALDLAAEESVVNGDGRINTGHLLLGLIRQQTGLAGRVLASMEVNEERCRAVLQQLDED